MSLVCVQSSVKVCNRSRAKSCQGNIVESLWGHGGGLAYFTHSELRFVRLNSCNRLHLHACLQCSSAFIFVFRFLRQIHKYKYSDKSSLVFELLR